jgi:hypothetical protein
MRRAACCRGMLSTPMHVTDDDSFYMAGSVMHSRTGALSPLPTLSTLSQSLEDKHSPVLLPSRVLVVLQNTPFLLLHASLSTIKRSSCEKRIYRPTAHAPVRSSVCVRKSAPEVSASALPGQHGRRFPRRPHGSSCARECSFCVLLSVGMARSQKRCTSCNHARHLERLKTFVRAGNLLPPPPSPSLHMLSIPCTLSPLLSSRPDH